MVESSEPTLNQKSFLHLEFPASPVKRFFHIMDHHILFDGKKNHLKVFSRPLDLLGGTETPEMAPTWNFQNLPKATLPALAKNVVVNENHHETPGCSFSAPRSAPGSSQ